MFSEYIACIIKLQDFRKYGNNFIKNITPRSIKFYMYILHVNNKKIQVDL